ncbi:MAG TPA: hypothetical protein VGK82_16150, partial [Pyrinomonadaceae bacterium]
MPWDVRRLAVLLAEQQILKLRPDDLESFDAIFVALDLKQPGIERALTAAVLKEGYTTTELRGFSVEFQRKLSRSNRVHRKMRRPNIDAAAVRDFIALARRDCKLTLARYLFTPEEIVDRVLQQVRVSDGLNDVDVAQPRFVDTELTHVWRSLPEFEARILKRLCAGTKIYWVSDATGCEINSLVEYPLSTVVLVIKPPGSHYEFEIKRAGRKGNPLNVVFTRNGNRVPPSHRLDGGAMQWLLRYEANNAAKLSLIYRLVHGVDAPLPGYLARNNVFNVPVNASVNASVNGSQAPAFRYFTEPRVFGGVGFQDMRASMKAAVDALQTEEGEFLPQVPGDMALTGEFLSHIAPAQALVCGTSSFRLDKVATYLSAEGAET